MKKVLILFLAVMPFIVFAVPSVVISKIAPIGNPISCGTAEYKVSIRNASAEDISLNSFYFDYDARLIPPPTIVFLSTFGGTLASSGATPSDPTHQRITITLLNSSGSPLIIPTGATLDIFTYNYNVPCLVLPIGSVVGSMFLTESITCNYSNSSGSFSMNTTITNNLDYANLFLSPTGNVLSTLSNMGATTTRTIRIESAGTAPGSVATPFTGYLNFYDHNLSCDLYKISKFKMQIIDRFFPFAETTIVDLIFSTPLTPGLIYTTPTQITLDRNHYIKITEEVILETTPVTAPHCIDGCPLGRITNDFDINYSCNSSSLCNHVTTFHGSIQKGTNAPRLVQTQDAYDNSCFLDPVFSALPSSGFVTHTRRCSNTGTANVYNVKLRLGAVGVTSTEVVRRGSLRMTAADGITIIPPSVINRYAGLVSGDLPTCVKSFQDLNISSTTDNDEPIQNADWEIPILRPGEEVVLEYTTYRCCPSDTNKFVGSFKEPEYIDMWRLEDIRDSDPDVENANECGVEIAMAKLSNNGPIMADLTLASIIGPTNLTGTAACDITHPTIYELPITKFCGGLTAGENERLLTNTTGGLVSGKLRVEVVTESGLNPTPVNPLRLTNISSPLIYVDMVSGTVLTPYSSSTGGRYQADFDLSALHNPSETATYLNLKNFLEHAYLSFPITPCCPGDPTPTMRVQFYLIPTPGACLACQVPIAQGSKKIQLHCPGCVTPGIIADKCTVERITPGYLDTDDDGLADNPGTFIPFTDVEGMISSGGYRYAASSFMRGDQIKLKFEAYGQDGDDADHGVSYATLMTEWGSHTSGYPSPAAFTDLNIEIINPCATTSQFDWTPAPASELLTVSRTVGGTTTVSSPIDISSYRISSGGSYFYRVPVSATGGPFLISTSTDERYAVEILYNTCGNGDAMDCEITTRLWWSGVSTHDETSFSTKPNAGGVNKLYTPSSYIPSEAYNRATQLLPDMIYLCEAYGSMITGFHILETYSSRWDDRNNPDFPSSLSCNKGLTNTYSIKVCGTDPTVNNIFPKEYRPIQPSVLDDYFSIPTGSPNYTYSPAGSTSGSTFIDWRPTSGYSPNIRSSVVPATLSSPSATWSIVGPYAILTEASPPSTGSSTNYYLSDEQTSLSVNYNFVPTSCALPGSLTPVDNTTNHSASSNPCSITMNNTFDIGHSILNLKTPNPNIQIFTADDPLSVYSSTPTCFNILVSNNSSGAILAENIIIHIPIPSAGGVINSVAIVGTPPVGVSITDIPLIGGARDCIINRLNTGETIQLKICFDVFTCDPLTPLELSYSYGCITSSACPPTVNRPITLISAPVALHGEVIDALPITADPCTPISLHSQFLLTSLGEVSALKIIVTLPETISSPVFTVSARDVVGSCGPYTLSPTVLPSAPSGGLVTYTITLDPSFILTLLPCTNEVLFEFEFSFGSCNAATFYPKIDMIAQKYCDQYGTDLISLDPPLIGEVNISGDVSACITPFISGTTTPASCLGHFDASITAVVTGPGPYTYTWIWNTLPYPTTISGPSPILSSPLTGVTSGSYTLIVEDGYGCKTTKDFTVSATSSAIPIPIVSSYSSTTCDVGTVVFNPIAAYTYTWTATNIATGYLSSGTAGPGVSVASTINLTFANPLNPSYVVIRATAPDGCYSEKMITIGTCCIWGNGPDPFPLIPSGSELSAYAIAFPGAFTPLSDNFRVNGILYVNNSYILDNCTFYMEPNSEIIVNGLATLTLNSCTFVACRDEMWKGFTLSANSHLVAQRYTGSTKDTRIYDALIGITSNSGADYQLNYVSMNRNFIDIDVKPFTGAAHPSSMINCTFFCNTEIPVFCGSVTPHADATLFAPHSTEKTSIGINVLNNNLLNIGQGGGTPFNPKTNYFWDMNYGIVAQNSRLEVINNSFKNMYQITGTAPGGDGINFTADIPTIGTYTKNLHAQFNVYSKIPHACISMFGGQAECTIEDESMDGAFGVLSNNLGSRFTTPGTCIYRPIKIYRNSILFTSAGVQLENSYRIVAEINNANTIAGPSFTTPSDPASFGVRISGVAISTNNSPRFTIDHNYIHNGRIGVSVQNILPTNLCGTYTNLIGQNYVYTDDPDEIAYRGIELTNANSLGTTQIILVTCNAIKGLNSYLTLPPPTPPINNFGIALDQSQNNTITCNDMNFLNRGFSYNNACVMTNRLAGNKFHFLNVHIFGTASSSLGNQPNLGAPIFPANEMIEIASVRAIINNGASYRYAYRSSPLMYDPTARGLLGGTNPPTLDLSSATIFTCPTICLPPAPYGASARPAEGEGEGMTIESDDKVEFALSLKESTDTAYAPDEEGLKKLNEELLYSMLKNDSSLLVNDTLQAFYDQKEIQHTGMLDEIRSLINGKEYIEAETKLADLPLNNEAEEANKAVYEILNKVEQREMYILSGEEMEILQTIANYCPIRYGQAVYSARVLIQTQYGYETSYWNDEELCISGIDYRRSNPNIKPETDLEFIKEFMIYPNPASTELNFKVQNSTGCLEGSDTKIEILDILGNSVLKKEYNGFVATGHLNISFLANGVYIIKFACVNNQIYRESFIINK